MLINFSTIFIMLFFLFFLECCYPDTFGEESFKGIYSYETTLRSKSVSKSCTYSNGTSFERSCLGNGIQQAKWQDVESLSLCKAFTKTTEELIELEKVCCKDLFHLRKSISYLYCTIHGYFFALLFILNDTPNNFWSVENFL